MEAITIGTQQYTDVRAALVEAGRLYSVVCLSRANYQAACAELGRALLVIKKQIKPGEWLRALAIAGIHAKTAQRAMRLAEAKAAGLDVGMHSAPAVMPHQNRFPRDQMSRAGGGDRAVANDEGGEVPPRPVVASGGGDDLEPIVDPDLIATDEEMEAMEEEPVEDDDDLGDEDVGDEDLDGLDEEDDLEELPGDDDEIEDAADRGAAGVQLSLTAVWDEIDRARERARDVARESGKAERVAQAVRKFEAELEEIRGA